MTEGMLDYEKIEIVANRIRKDITDIIEVVCTGLWELSDFIN